VSARSYLYVPGDRQDLLARASGRGADALIIDLEDGVASSAKPAARGVLARWLASQARPAPAEVWVRVNSLSIAAGQDTAEDLKAAIAPGVTGICLAKCQGQAEAERLAELLDQAEARAGLTAGSLRVSAILESARGWLAAPAIAAARRVGRLQIGEADLLAELAMTPGPDEAELIALRTQVVVASAAAGIEAPIGPVSTNFRDLGAFRTTTTRLRRLGFGGRATIHPAQIPIVNEVFTPSEAEVDAARAIIERFEAATSNGTGVIVAADGAMVDEAVIRAARSILGRVRP
jgi:citrate lyase subunit beta / citryl-CoA lyase